MNMNASPVPLRPTDQSQMMETNPSPVMAELPEDRTRITKPSLFVAATKDQVCRADLGKMTMKQFAPGAEIVDIDAGHWVQLEATAQLNQVLEKWLGGLSLASSL